MRRFPLSFIALAAALAAPLTASAQPDPGFIGIGVRYDDRDSYDRYDHTLRVFGRIADAHGGSLRLENGRTIFLRDHTAIDPVGWRLRPGQRIEIRGYDAGNGAINAREIDVLPSDGERAREWDHDRDHDGYRD